MAVAQRGRPPESAGAAAPAQVGAGWARERLWLGMSNVGTWVVIASAGLLLGIPDVGSDLAMWSVAVLGYVAIQAPFDWIGGAVLQRRHGRPTPPAGAAIAGWVRGTAVHAAVLWAAGLLLLSLHDAAGPIGVIGGAAFAMMLVLALQLPLLRWVSGLRHHRDRPEWVDSLRAAGIDPGRVRVVDTTDPGFVGGWAGLPGREVLVVPQDWRTLLDEAALRAQLVRRRVALRSGQRVRGVVLALGWNLVGFGAAALTFGAASAAELIATVALFTLWSFVGLLVLPTPSRAGVLAVDRGALGAPAPAEALATAMARLDGVHDDEPARSDLVETIFHPVPSLNRRRANLEGGEEPSGGAWHAARMALLLGWALGSPLSRAVHCNVGRPQLWAMFPGD